MSTPQQTTPETSEPLQLQLAYPLVRPGFEATEAPADVATPEHYDQRRQRPRRSLARKLTYLTMVAGLSEGIAAHEAPNFELGVQVQRLPNLLTTECPAPTPQNIITAGRWLGGAFGYLYDGRYNFRYAQLQANGLGPHTAGHPADLLARNDVKHIAAEMFHQTVFDTGPAVNGLTYDLYPSQRPYNPLETHPAKHTAAELPFSTYFKEAQDFVAQYGIGINVASQNDTLDHGFKAPRPADLDQFKVKENLYNLIVYMSNQTKEYVQFIGQSRFVLGWADPADFPPDQPPPFAYTDSTNGEIVLNMAYSLAPMVFAHEQGHLLRWAVCGGVVLVSSSHDRGFEALNDGQAYTDDGSPSLAANETPSDVADYVKRLQETQNNDQQQGLANSADGVGSIIAEVQQGVHFWDSYSASDLNEDHANTGGQMTMAGDGGIPIMRDNYPSLKAKFTYDFARTLQYKPEIAAWYAAMDPDLAMFNQPDENPVVRQAFRDLLHEYARNHPTDSCAVSIVYGPDGKPQVSFVKG